MTNRVTQKDIEQLAMAINNATNSPTTYFTVQTDGTRPANIGHHYIAGAFGGVRLERINSTGGGTYDACETGYVTKRELYAAMRAYLAGMKVTIS